MTPFWFFVPSAGGGGGGGDYLIDAITTQPIAGWSCARLINGDYTGYISKVYRTSDGEERDIAFDANEEKSSSSVVYDSGSPDGTLSSFLSGTDGYDQTIYDQIGSYDASNATATSAALAASSGSLLTFGTNSKPCWKIDQKSNTFTQMSLSDYTIVAVGYIYSNAYQNPVVAYDDNNYCSFGEPHAGKAVEVKANGTYIRTSSPDVESLSVIAWNEEEIYINGVAQSLGTAGNPLLLDAIGVGSSNGSYFRPRIYLGEVLIYNSNLSSSDISDLTDNMSDYWGIS